MAISIITKEDLQQFKIELLEGIEFLLKGKTTEQKLWLRSSEVKKLLNISSGTLQNLRINGTLSYSKIGGSLYYNYKDIQKLLTDVKH
ncbi:Helix-turn-helix domain-containing protein [Chryseobacterium taichungense]|uniref:Helix-turn-helix domain-containing protein n=1 Tax=Chryseobacterium taichungense TaxID=295069 RepID=A0A1H7YGR6_9FLAO|nr:helix-turn-helix domain-containing protein [Chryseobacterium taichungense]SEM45091.1 Helix-turn-helix domain-containing protein [Chryseobacterium taichungense]